MPVKITLAAAMGTCFGVQDAIDMALDPSYRGNLTIVGQLVHNPQITERLLANGVRIVERNQIDSITTQAVMITAHGASDTTKAELQRRGFTVYDATCPLVIRLHKLARFLEREGWFPVIIGKADHVEVKGVVGNLRASAVVYHEQDFELLRGQTRLGVVSQTTNRLDKVQRLLSAMRALPWVEQLRFVDTVCQPVKERQAAIATLLEADIDLGIVVGGQNSANTAKLREVIADKGIAAFHVERPEEVDPRWFVARRHVGITAGTSTPPDVIEAVERRVREIVGG
jgi:4-hydroxy-3-methylbut-2-enyl diphosphate reductase